MSKMVTMTLIGTGSVAWHGNTSHNAHGVIMGLIEEGGYTEGQAEVHFSIVVEGVGGKHVVASPNQIRQKAEIAMTSLGLQKLCDECQSSLPSYSSAGVHLCHDCAREVGWLDVLEDAL